MKSAQQASEATPSLLSSKCAPMAELYKNVLMQFQDSKKKRNFGNLWSRVAPSGNIYRYNGLTQERMRHCYDLDQQLQEIAEETKKILVPNCKDASTSQCADVLLEALKMARVKGLADGSEEQEIPEGFMPIEEFLDHDVGYVAGIHYPLDPDKRHSWMFNTFLAWVVFLIQTLGPLLVVIQLWYADSNQLEDPRKMWKHLTWKETVCMGTSRTAVLTTIVGTLFVLLVNLIIYNHSVDQCESAEKMGRVPADNGWLIIGNIAESCCSLLLLLAIPLEFWGEDGVTGIMMNSMALLFVFNLDDLTGDVFDFLGDDDNEFQKQVAWNFALLAHCPISLRDLINPNATSKEDIWKICYSPSGSLMTATGEVCQTRIKELKDAPQEDTPLNKDDGDDQTLENMIVEYRVTRTGGIRHLPGFRAMALKYLWFMTNSLITVAAMVTPIVWFIFNKPCTIEPEK